MQLKPLAVIAIFISYLLLGSCGKKHIPERTEDPAATPAAAVKKPAVKKVAIPVAKVIVVNDNVAKKNIDGRLYYDVGGHRYWKNYDDGKYYLFNKTMYTDKAYKPH